MSPDISESDRKFANEAIGLFDALVLHPEWTHEDAVVELVATLKVYIRQQQPYRKGWEEAIEAAAARCESLSVRSFGGNDGRDVYQLTTAAKAIRSIPAPEGEMR
jgi:hypothetical protein